MFDKGSVTVAVGRWRAGASVPGASGRDELVRRADAAHVAASRAQRELFSAIAELDRDREWQQDGARDLAHWLSMRYGISNWKAHRWIRAAGALRELPGVARAFGNGELSVDKLLELCRFATPLTEHDLLVWARKVSVAAVRRKGDLEVRRSEDETREVERARTLSWWYLDEGRRFCLEAELPAAQGAIVAKALERMAAQIPEMPDEGDGAFASARRADALVALCSAKITSDPDPDRATVVVHASVETLTSDDPQRAPGAEIEDGPVIPAATARRLACTARVQTVVESREGEPVALGRLTRQPSRAMVRLVRQRDRGCVFPGCGTRRFTEAHHVVWWRHGGRTDLSNLALICSFHHRLVHEHGWTLERDPDGAVRWLRPDGVRYRAGPATPGEMSHLDGYIRLIAAG